MIGVASETFAAGLVVYIPHTMYAVPGEKRQQPLTIFPVVTQDGGRDSWDLAAGDAPTGA